MFELLWLFQAQKELLDAEIELYQKQQEGSDTTELQKKVYELHSQSKSFTHSSVRGISISRRGIGRAACRGTVRGRGRGLAASRGGGRGRGRSGYYVAPHVSVDRRPTQLKIVGFQATQHGDVLAFFAVSRDNWLSHKSLLIISYQINLQNFGEVVDYQFDESVPALAIRYKSRKDAELALGQGKMFTETPLLVAWDSVVSPSTNRKVKEGSMDDRIEQDVGSASAEEDEDENEVIFLLKV